MFKFGYYTSFIFRKFDRLEYSFECIRFPSHFSTLFDSVKTAELEAQYQIFGTLSDITNGTSGKRISLQRFVLSVLLDDVLIQASKRLHIMSKGRYRLLRKINLQSSGRMIGIISHVTELKEQMALRIDVKSSREGSSITTVSHGHYNGIKGVTV